MPSNQGLYFTLCKRPLAVNIFNIDRTCLENSHSNLYHFHFFLNKRNKDTFKVDFLSENEKQHVTIDDNCEKNNFSNFGFFGDTESLFDLKLRSRNIQCDENITKYEQCHTFKFGKNIILNSLENLLNDFKYNKYNLSKYNCQTFSKNIIEIYNYKDLSLFKNEAKCYQFINYNFLNHYTLDYISTVILGCKDSVSTTTHHIEKYFNNTIQYEWQDNPKYKNYND
ncbi:hypothetical protein HOK00_01525 [bacterium]|jgi:hypothetical protein|nr:hypothetical protein [bacterium]